MAHRVQAHWIGGLLVATLLLGGLSVLNLARDVGQPFPGFHAFRNVTRDVWQVESSTPPWWSPLASGAVRYSDELLAVNGAPFGERWGAAAAFTLTLRREGALVEQRLPVETFTVNNLLDLKLPDLINGFGFWLLALAVYRTRPQLRLNRVFAACGCVLAASQWLTIEGLFPESDWPTLLLRLGWALNAPFLGVTFIHLTTLFPMPMAGLRYPVRGLYALAALLSVGYVGALLAAWLGAATTPLSGLCFRLSLGAFGVACGLYLARLSWLAVQRDLAPRLRRQLALLLVGMTLALPHVAAILSGAMLTGAQSYFWRGLDLRYLTLAVPLSFAIVILRYQTFKRNHPVLIAIVALAASALLASLGAWAVQTARPDWAQRLGGSIFPLLFVSALVVSFFWSNWRQWEGAFNQFLRWEQRSYAAVREVGQAVLSQPDLRSLPATLAQALAAHLALERAAVWIETNGALALAGRAGRWSQTPPSELQPDGRLASPVRLHANDTAAWLAALPACGVEIVAPLVAEGRLIGLLGFGARGDDEIFDERDVEIIELIAQQSALFVLTARQVDELRRVPQQVAAAEERERLRIAQELHDTTQQFLGRLPFFLQVSRDAVRADPPEAEAILARLLPQVEGAAQTLRQIRHNLAPAQLEHSLGGPLLTLIDQFQRECGCAVHLDIAPALDQHLSTETRHALYRVVQQALDNVAEHAGARNVTLTLAVAEGRVTLALSDDGRGSSEAERAQAEAAGSFGLKSMRARFTGLGGELVITSQPGAGTHLRGWLPAALIP